MASLPLLALLLAPASAAPVSFKTPDGWTIRADYTPPRKGLAVAVMVHGVAAGKGEWLLLRQALARRGVGSLAIDLRGHGESLQGPAGKADFSGFDEARTWPECRQDIEAAAAYLRRRGIQPERVGYVGASIGANLASWAQPRPRFLVLLSPGLDYRGVRLSRAPAGLPVLAAAAPEDAYAWRTAEDFASRNPGAVFLQASGGHGAQMFADKPFLAELASWISGR
jgi:pimeloyl-ACP methyl ester carboxylesterase